MCVGGGGVRACVSTCVRVCVRACARVRSCVLCARAQDDKVATHFKKLTWTKTKERKKREEKKREEKKRKKEREKKEKKVDTWILSSEGYRIGTNATFSAQKIQP